MHLCVFPPADRPRISVLKLPGPIHRGAQKLPIGPMTPSPLPPPQGHPPWDHLMLLWAYMPLYLVALRNLMYVMVVVIVLKVTTLATPGAPPKVWTQWDRGGGDKTHPSPYPLRPSLGKPRVTYATPPIVRARPTVTPHGVRVPSNGARWPPDATLCHLAALSPWFHWVGMSLAEDIGGPALGVCAKGWHRGCPSDTIIAWLHGHFEHKAYGPWGHSTLMPPPRLATKASHQGRAGAPWQA